MALPTVEISLQFVSSVPKRLSETDCKKTAYGGKYRLNIQQEYVWNL